MRSSFASNIPFLDFFFVYFTHEYNQLHLSHEVHGISTEHHGLQLHGSAYKRTVNSSTITVVYLGVLVAS